MSYDRSREAWYLTSEHASAPSSIEVIEPAAKPKGKKGKRPKKVAFGFSRALAAKGKRKRR